MFASVIVGVLLWLAAAFDIRSYRVPNKLILVGLLIGGLYRLGSQGLMGGGLFLLQVGLTGLIFYPFAHFRMFGAGDVKLFMMTAGFLGSRFIVRFSVASIVVAAIISFMKMLWHRNLCTRLRILASYLYVVFVGRQWRSYPTGFDEEQKDAVIPFAFPMAVAYLLCMWDRSELLLSMFLG